jgi:hypothetical protein
LYKVVNPAKLDKVVEFGYDFDELIQAYHKQIKSKVIEGMFVNYITVGHIFLYKDSRVASYPTHPGYSTAMEEFNKFVEYEFNLLVDNNIIKEDKCMYYLLSDKRIINGNNLPLEWLIYDVRIDLERGIIHLDCPDPRDRKKFFIEDWSYNIFKLLSPGDLVARKRNSPFATNPFFVVHTVTEVTDSGFSCYEGYFEPEIEFYKFDEENDFIFVYKQDYVGDYIKTEVGPKPRLNQEDKTPEKTPEVEVAFDA